MWGGGESFHPSMSVSQEKQGDPQKQKEEWLRFEIRILAKGKKNFGDGEGLH